ncbi:titin-like isoform X2 [Panonychus citri]|uniref:titin-like isoform X2 n=1 Tax=Panonychus citri TaxID=50023 RepID=UPI002307ED58|nr:titin-like isoform X2 [Panonychus citri]
MEGTVALDIEIPAEKTIVTSISDSLHHSYQVSTSTADIAADDLSQSTPTTSKAAIGLTESQAASGMFSTSIESEKDLDLEVIPEVVKPTKSLTKKKSRSISIERKQSYEKEETLDVIPSKEETVQFEITSETQAITVGIDVPVEVEDKLVEDVKPKVKKIKPKKSLPKTRSASIERPETLDKEEELEIGKPTEITAISSVVPQRTTETEAVATLEGDIVVQKEIPVPDKRARETTERDLMKTVTTERVNLSGEPVDQQVDALENVYEISADQTPIEITARVTTEATLLEKEVKLTQQSTLIADDQPYQPSIDQQFEISSKGQKPIRKEIIQTFKKVGDKITSIQVESTQYEDSIVDITIESDDKQPIEIESKQRSLIVEEMTTEIGGPSSPSSSSPTQSKVNQDSISIELPDEEEKEITIKPESNESIEIVPEMEIDIESKGREKEKKEKEKEKEKDSKKKKVTKKKPQFSERFEVDRNTDDLQIEEEDSLVSVPEVIPELMEMIKDELMSDLITDNEDQPMDDKVTTTTDETTSEPAKVKVYKAKLRIPGTRVIYKVPRKSGRSLQRISDSKETQIQTEEIPEQTFELKLPSSRVESELTTTVLESQTKEEHPADIFVEQTVNLSLKGKRIVFRAKDEREQIVTETIHLRQQDFTEEKTELRPEEEDDSVQTFTIKSRGKSRSSIEMNSESIEISLDRKISEIESVNEKDKEDVESITKLKVKIPGRRIVHRMMVSSNASETEISEQEIVDYVESGPEDNLMLDEDEHDKRSLDVLERVSVKTTGRKILFRVPHEKDQQETESTEIQSESDFIQPDDETMITVDSDETVNLKTTGRKVLFRVPQTSSKPEIEELEIVPDQMTETPIDDIQDENVIDEANQKIDVKITGRKILFRVPRKSSVSSEQEIEISSEEMNVPETSEQIEIEKISETQDLSQDVTITSKGRDKSSIDLESSSIEVEKTKETETVESPEKESPKEIERKDSTFIESIGPIVVIKKKIPGEMITFNVPEMPLRKPSLPTEEKLEKVTIEIEKRKKIEQPEQVEVSSETLMITTSAEQVTESEKPLETDESLDLPKTRKESIAKPSIVTQELIVITGSKIDESAAPKDSIVPEIDELPEISPETTLSQDVTLRSKGRIRTSITSESSQIEISSDERSFSTEQQLDVIEPIVISKVKISGRKIVFRIPCEGNEKEIETLELIQENIENQVSIDQPSEMDESIETTEVKTAGRKIVFKLPRRSSQSETELHEVPEELQESVDEISSDYPSAKEDSGKVDDSIEKINLKITGRKILFRVPRKLSKPEIGETEEQSEAPVDTFEIFDDRPVEIQETEQDELTVTKKKIPGELSSFDVPETPLRKKSIPDEQTITTDESICVTCIKVTGRKVVFRVPRKSSQPEIETFELSPEKALISEISSDEIERETSDELDIDKKSIDQKTETTEENVKPIQEIRITTKGSKKTKTKLESTELEMEKDQFKFVDITEDIDEKELEVQATIELKKPKDKDQPFSSEIEKEKISETQDLSQDVTITSKGRDKSSIGLESSSIEVEKTKETETVESPEEESPKEIERKDSTVIESIGPIVVIKKKIPGEMVTFNVPEMPLRKPSLPTEEKLEKVTIEIEKRKKIEHPEQVEVSSETLMITTSAEQVTESEKPLETDELKPLELSVQEIESDSDFVEVTDQFERITDKDDSSISTVEIVHVKTVGRKVSFKVSRRFIESMEETLDMSTETEPSIVNQIVEVKTSGRKVVYKVQRRTSQTELGTNEMLLEKPTEYTTQEIELTSEDKQTDETNVESALEIHEAENVQEISITSKGREKTFAVLESEQIEVEKKPEQEFLDIDDTIEMVTKNITGRKILFRVPRRSSQQEIETLELEEQFDEQVQRKDSITVQSDETVLIKKRIPGEIVTFNVSEIPIRKKSIPDEQTTVIDESIEVNHVKVTGRKVVFRVPKGPSQEIVETDENIPEQITDETQLEEIIIPIKTIELITEDQKPIDETENKSTLEIEKTDESESVQEISITSKGREKTSIQLESEQIEVEKLPEHVDIVDSIEKVTVQISGRKILFRVPRRLSQPELTESHPEEEIEEELLETETIAQPLESEIDSEEKTELKISGRKVVFRVPRKDSQSEIETFESIPEIQDSKETTQFEGSLEKPVETSELLTSGRRIIFRIPKKVDKTDIEVAPDEPDEMDIEASSIQQTIELITSDEKSIDKTEDDSLMKTENIELTQEITITSKGRERTSARLESEKIEVEKLPKNIRLEVEASDEKVEVKIKGRKILFKVPQGTDKIDTEAEIISDSQEPIELSDQPLETEIDSEEKTELKISGRKVVFRVPRKDSQPEIETFESIPETEDADDNLENFISEKVDLKTIGRKIVFRVPHESSQTKIEAEELLPETEDLHDQLSIDKLSETTHTIEVQTSSRKVLFRVPQKTDQPEIEEYENIHEQIEAEKKPEQEVTDIDESRIETTIKTAGRKILFRVPQEKDQQETESTEIQSESDFIQPDDETMITVDSDETINLKTIGRKVLFRVPQTSSKPEIEELEIVPDQMTETPIDDIQDENVIDEANQKIDVKITGRKILFRVPRKSSVSSEQEIEISSEEMTVPETSEQIEIVKISEPQDLSQDVTITSKGRDKSSIDLESSSIEVEKTKETETIESPEEESPKEIERKDSTVIESIGPIVVIKKKIPGEMVTFNVPEMPLRKPSLPTEEKLEKVTIEIEKRKKIEHPEQVEVSSETLMITTSAEQVTESEKPLETDESLDLPKARKESIAKPSIITQELIVITGSKIDESTTPKDSIGPEIESEIKSITELKSDATTDQWKPETEVIEIGETVNVKITDRKILFRVPCDTSQSEIEQFDLTPEKVSDGNEQDKIEVPTEKLAEDSSYPKAPKRKKRKGETVLENTDLTSMPETVHDVDEKLPFDQPSEMDESIETTEVKTAGRKIVFKLPRRSSQSETELHEELQESVDEISNDYPSAREDSEKVDDSIEKINLKITGRKILFRVPRKLSKPEIGETEEQSEAPVDTFEIFDDRPVEIQETEQDELTVTKKKIPGELSSFDVPETPLRKKSIPDEQSIEIDKSVHVTNVRITGKKVVFRVPKRPSQEIVETDENIPEQITDETQLEMIIIPTKTIELVTEDQKPIDETEKKSTLEIEKTDESESVQEISITSKGREKTSIQLESEQIEVEKLPEQERVESDDSIEKIDFKLKGRKILFRVPEGLDQMDTEAEIISESREPTELVEQPSCEVVLNDSNEKVDVNISGRKVVFRVPRKDSQAEVESIETVATAGDSNEFVLIDQSTEKSPESTELITSGRKILFRIPHKFDAEKCEIADLTDEISNDETKPEITFDQQIVGLISGDQKPIIETEAQSALEINKPDETTQNVQEISIASKGREKTSIKLESEQIEVEKRPEQEFIDIDDTIEMVTKNITGRKILFRVPRRSSQQEIETLELEEQFDEQVQRKDSITAQSDETVLIKKRIPGEIISFEVPEFSLRRESVPSVQPIEVGESVDKMSVKIAGRKVVFRVPKGPSQEEVKSDEIIPEQIIDETQPEEINIPKKIIELVIEDQKPMDETQVKSLLEIQKTENVQEISIASKGREKTFAVLESEQIEVEKKPEQEFLDIDDTIEMVTKNITGRKILFRAPRRSSQQEVETLELEEKIDEQVQRKDSITVQSDETVLIKKRIPGEIVTFDVSEIPIRKKSILDEQTTVIDESIEVNNVKVTGRKVVFRVPKGPSQEIVETDENIPEQITDETQLEEIIIPTKTIQLITEDQKPIDETENKSTLEIEKTDESESVQEISIASKGREKTSIQLESEQIEVEKLPEHVDIVDSIEKVTVQISGRKILFRVPRRLSQPELTESHPEEGREELLETETTAQPLESEIDSEEKTELKISGRKVVFRVPRKDSQPEIETFESIPETEDADDNLENFISEKVDLKTIGRKIVFRVPHESSQTKIEAEELLPETEDLHDQLSTDTLLETTSSIEVQTSSRKVLFRVPQKTDQPEIEEYENIHEQIEAEKKPEQEVTDIDESRIETTIKTAGRKILFRVPHEKINKKLNQQKYNQNQISFNQMMKPR